VAARGLWIDMLALIHECSCQGQLQINGQPLRGDRLYRMLGISPEDGNMLIEELRQAGVCSETAHGIFFSRRMTRDSKLSDLRRKSGQKGGNSTQLKNKELAVFAQASAQASAQANLKQVLKQELKQTSVDDSVCKFVTSTELQNSNVVSGEEGSREKGSVRRQKKKPASKHRFQDSPYHDPGALREALDDWFPEMVDEYWHILHDASEADHSLLYNNWAAAARNWRRRREEKTTRRQV